MSVFGVENGPRRHFYCFLCAAMVDRCCHAFLDLDRVNNNNLHMKTSLSHLMCLPIFMGLHVEKRNSHKISISMIAAKFWVSSRVINPSSGKMCCPFQMTKCTRFIIFAWVSVCELGTSSWNESSHLNKLLILITPQSTVAYQLIYQEVTRANEKFCKQNRPHWLRTVRGSWKWVKRRKKVHHKEQNHHKRQTISG